MVKQWLQNPRVLLGILITIAVLISIQKFYLPINPKGVTGYNNYLIFKHSFFNLINGEDIYQHFPSQYKDLFKYSPAFALLMFIWAPLPNLIGLMLWNIVNVLVLFLGIKKLPIKPKYGLLLFILFIVIELITSTQNSQCNALIAGMILLAHYHLEKGKMLWATLLIVGTVYIKLFGIVAFALFLFYPKKIKAAGYATLWGVLLGLLPLIVISWPQLIDLYESWGNLLTNDHDENLKLSVMGILNSWFNIPASYKTTVLITGMIAFCLPLLKINRFKEKRFRLLYVSSILIWVIIFNHMAESATFIIAVVGIAVWYFTKNHTTKLDTFLLVITIVLTILSPTDIFPKSFRDEILVPYTIKVLPCILIWIKINWEMLFPNNAPSTIRMT